MNTTASMAMKIANLSELPMPELWSLWDEYFPHRPVKTSRDYLQGRIAFKMQEAVYGGLSELTRNRLIQIGSSQSTIKARVSNPDNQLLPGTVLIREHDNQEHRVTVTPSGTFEYQGKQYKSLSAVARHITGTQWNGPVFFGVKKSGGSK
jgi:hypothetical protein